MNPVKALLLLFVTATTASQVLGTDAPIPAPIVPTQAPVNIVAPTPVIAVASTTPPISTTAAPVVASPAAPVLLVPSTTTATTTSAPLITPRPSSQPTAPLAPEKLVISRVFDSFYDRIVELAVCSDIPDLSKYVLLLYPPGRKVALGGFSFFNTTIIRTTNIPAGSRIHLVSNSLDRRLFQELLGFPPGQYFVSWPLIDFDGRWKFRLIRAGLNYDFKNVTTVDSYGDVGSGSDFQYGWAVRKSNTSATGHFNYADWNISPYATWYQPEREANQYSCTLPTVIAPSGQTPTASPTKRSATEKLVISGVFHDQYESRIVELTACSHITSFIGYSLLLFLSGTKIHNALYEGDNVNNIPAGSKIYIADGSFTVDYFQDTFGFLPGPYFFPSQGLVFNGGSSFRLLNEDGRVIDAYGDVDSSVSQGPTDFTFGFALRKSGTGATGRFNIRDWNISPDFFSVDGAQVRNVAQYSCPLPPGSTPRPTKQPTRPPTQRPTTRPTSRPTNLPTSRPTMVPTTAPTTPSSCFSEANTVEVQGKGIVAMNDLHIGDNVKDAYGNMVSVYSFGHYQPNVTAEYLQIYVRDGNNRPLEVSKDHLLFVNGVAIPASTIRVGDRIDLGANATTTAELAIPSTATSCSSPRRTQGLVEKIQVVVRNGLYGPITTSGTIVVNGVSASTYVTLQDDSAVLVLGGFSTFLSMHWFAHIGQTPHRLICSAAFLGAQGCRKWETYTKEGISIWVAAPYYTVRFLLSFHQETFAGVIATALVLIPVFLLVLMLYLVEVGWIYFLLALLIAKLLSRMIAKKSRKTLN